MGPLLFCSNTFMVVYIVTSVLCISGFSPKYYYNGSTTPTTKIVDKVIHHQEKRKRNTLLCHTTDHGPGYQTVRTQTRRREDTWSTNGIPFQNSDKKVDFYSGHYHG